MMMDEQNNFNIFMSSENRMSKIVTRYLITHNWDDIKNMRVATTDKIRKDIFNKSLLLINDLHDPN